jgi:hypothetical protein
MAELIGINTDQPFALSPPYLLLFCSKNIPKWK